jgi:hypothetical protein
MVIPVVTETAEEPAMNCPGLVPSPINIFVAVTSTF